MALRPQHRRGALWVAVGAMTLGVPAVVGALANAWGAKLPGLQRLRTLAYGVPPTTQTGS